MNATNKYFATWPIGWGLGDTQEEAIKVAISNNKNLAKMIIKHTGSLRIWTCKCNEDFTSVKYSKPQCKQSEPKYMYVTKILKNEIFMIEGIK